MHMRFFHHLYALFILVMHMKTGAGFVSGIGDYHIRCIKHERQALLKIKQDLVDNYNHLSSWGSEEGKEDCCKWRGIQCSNRTGHVIMLDLHVSDNKPLRGNISHSLLELQHLSYLDLSCNDFQGTLLPNFNGSLRKLRYLNISNAGVIGTLSNQLWNLSSLRSLDLSNNELEGKVPNFFGNFCSLHTLDLHGNKLTGELPVLFEHLSGCTEKSLQILKLEMNQLHGSLPDFTRFSSLKELIVYSNQINGSFPRKFSRLSALVVLDVGDNQLKGSLPDLSMFPLLEKLCIVYNRLNGTITQSIGGLSKLELLYVSHNSFEGVITEAHFQNLYQLKEVYFNDNPLALRFSSDWLPPFQLDIIGLNSCNLGPHFPKWLRTQNNYSVLDISDAGISGSVPHWFWDLPPRLFFLNISYNQLSGRVPDLYLKFDGSPGIDLSSNLFEGPLPLLPSNSSSLNLSKNKFLGSVSSVCKIIVKTLKFLDLSSNQLSGDVPDNCFLNGKQLVILNLADNNFSGKIPGSVGSLSLLRTFTLRKNSFFGEIPSSLKNCTQLRFLDLGYNRLSGIIPAWIGESQGSLMFLSLQSNALQGSISVHLCWLQNILLLDLSLNNISGTIPHCLKNFTLLTRKQLDTNNIYFYNFSSASGGEGDQFVGIYFDSGLIGWKGRAYYFQKNLQLLRIINLSGNRLTGEIPREITSLLALDGLNISRNDLNGVIPEEIGRLKNLQWLDLSRNHLSGVIPESMAEMNFLAQVDVSYNNLSGRIPTSTQLQSFDASAFDGNLEICGLPVTKTCRGDDGAPGQPTNDDSQDKEEEEEEDDADEFRRWFYVGLGCGFSIGICGVLVNLLLLPSWTFACLQFGRKAR